MNKSLKETIRETGFKDYLGVILRRKAVILLALSSVVGSTIFFVNRVEDIYESYSTVVIEEPNQIISQAMNTTAGRSLSFYQGILNSRTYLEMVADSIGLDVFKASFPDINRDGAILYVQNSMELRKTSYTSFYHLNVRAKTKELAFLIATTGTGIFRDQCQVVSTEESRRTVVEIEKQLKLVRAKLEQAERDYRTFKEETGEIAGGTTPELRTLQQTYAQNLAQLGVKEADLTAEKRLLAKLEKQVTPAEQTRSPEYLKLRAKLQELEKEKLRLENLGIRLSGVSTIDREIDEIERQLLRYKQSKNGSHPDASTIRQWQELRKSVLNKETELELFKRRLDSYQNAISQYKKGNPGLLGKSLELQRLARAKEIYENIYSFLLNKAEEKRIASASGGTGIKTVDTARMPEKPIPKNEMRYYILGIVLGLALGVGLAFMVEFNDTSIKSNDDVERYLGLAVLGTIPHISVSKKSDIEIRRRSSKKMNKKSVTQYPRQLLTFSGEDSIITEAYRSLRTNLSFASPDNPLQTMVLTSAGPSEGKSLTITNIALAHAQMGKKVLLVDTDLRRPILHHLFNKRREPGFTELFGESPDYDTSIRSTERENLSILTAGLFTPNPAELIASQRMAQHLEYFRNHFDIIFFDTPPVVAVTDASLLASKSDGAMLVVKSRQTDREIAARAVKSLQNVGAKLVGVVLNDIDLSHRYSSYGYYKYYYHYYKSKAD